MALIIPNATVYTYTNNNEIVKKLENPVVIKLSDEQDNILISFKENETSLSNLDEDFQFFKDSEKSRLGKDLIVINNEQQTLIFRFSNLQDLKNFNNFLKDFKNGTKCSTFSQVS